MKEINVRLLVDFLKLEVLVGNEYLNRPVLTNNISRPGLELAGQIKYYQSDRIQIIGQKEFAFLEQLETIKASRRIAKLCKSDTPCFIFTRMNKPSDEIIAVIKKKKIPVLITKYSTTTIMNHMTNYLNPYFAEMTSVHGVMTDIYGVGVLIQGKSGIGKSEIALELVERKHRLVADDRVDLYEYQAGLLVARAPEVLKNFIEVRGVGIVNVMTLFGAGALRSSKRLNLIVELVEWDDNAVYNRLGIETVYVDILHTSVTKTILPIKPGRSMASLIEVAAMDFRLKEEGINSREEFMEGLRVLIDGNK